MAALAPWPGAGGRIAVAVSGGADSTALVLLARDWAAARSIGLLALVLDHGLRPESSAEADSALVRLAGCGIAGRKLRLLDLSRGPGLAERARIARHRALAEACRTAGIVDLLLGHHADDQAETVLIRSRAGSGPDGLAGMAALNETGPVRLLRPLLGLPRDALRATLRERDIGWSEDPSNVDPRAGRTAARAALSADPSCRAGLLARAAASGHRRMAARRNEAALLAQGVTLHPEAYALLPPGLVPAACLSALIRCVGGRRYPPARGAVERLVRTPRAATLGGTRLQPAGRLGPGWLLSREPAAMAAAVPARPGAMWDNRFRLRDGCCVPGLEIGALGGDGAGGRARRFGLPAVVAMTLPALRLDGQVVAVPHLGWAAAPDWAGFRFCFEPPSPASEAMLFLHHDPDR